MAKVQTVESGQVVREQLRTEIMAMLKEVYEGEVAREKANAEIQRDYGYQIASEIDEKGRRYESGQLYVLFNLAERTGLTDDGTLFHLKADYLRAEVRGELVGADQ